LADAATFTWTKFGSGNYNDPNNYFPFGAPGASDFVSFEVGAGFPYTVTFPGNDLINSPGGGGGGSNTASYAARFLRIRDNNVTFSGSTSGFKGPSALNITSTIENETDRGLIVGVFSGENSQLSLAHNSLVGGVLSNVNAVAATLGDGAGATGTMNVAVGAFNVTGSDFTQKQFIVGNHGTGVLNVTGGADVNVTGGNSTMSLGLKSGGVGTVNISGAGSTLFTANQLWVGELGTGTINVRQGGTLNTESSAGFSNIIGTFNNARGEVNVTGPGSTWNNKNRLNVGNSGDGSLNITGGGTFNQTNGFNDVTVGLGSLGGGFMSVTGAGSTFNSAGALRIGSTGDGALSIQNGGVVNAGRVVLRGLNEGSADVLVAGVGSRLNVTNVLEMGMPEGGFTTGPTRLTIGAGAAVTVGQDVEMDANSLLRLQGGTLTSNYIGSHDLLANQIEGTFEWSAGTLHVGYFGGSLNNPGGALAPGAGAGVGRTTIDGNYTQGAGGTLAMQIGGLTPETQHDFAYVEGAASLGGLLDLSLTGGFLPAGDQIFAILESASGVAGAFNNVANGERLATSDGIGSFLVHYGASSAMDANKIVLSNFLPTAAADFDGDGDVDGDDLEAWKDGYGSEGGPDADGDGDTDGNDFLDWQRGAGGGGAPAAPPARIGAVPEPASVALAAMGLLAALAIRRPRWGRKVA
jgi:T5SS/PEP-CTERM-associated repeat protein